MYVQRFSYSRDLLGDAWGLLGRVGSVEMVVGFNAKKTHPRLRWVCFFHIERRWADGLRCVENSEKPHR